jgi:mRNA interferase MazF
MPYEFGDVVLVRFPFTNQATFKQRPAAIVSSRAYNVAKPDVVIMAITSQVHSPSSLGDQAALRQAIAAVLG